MVLTPAPPGPVDHLLSGMRATLAGVAEGVLTVDIRPDLATFAVQATVDQDSLSTGLVVTCPVDFQVAGETILGTEVIRAQTVITLGPALSVNGSPVEVIAGQRVEIGDGTVIGGSFRAGGDPDAGSL